MGQVHKLGKIATSVIREANTIRVIYHSTVVIEWDAEKIIVNSGGWRTVTTKTRINQASNQYGLGLQVYQKAKKWYVQYNDTVREFNDNMIIDR